MPTTVFPGWYAPECVGIRRVVNREFGRYVTGLREAENWTQSDAARYAKQRGLRRVTRQVLIHLEAGKTQFPEPDLIREVAQLYRQTYDDLARRFFEHRYGVPLEAADKSDGSPAKSATARVRTGKAGEPETPAQDLLTESASHGSPTLASARVFLERIHAQLAEPLLDLSAFIDRLPGRQAPVDRRATSGGPQRPRPDRRPANRPHPKKAPAR